MGIGSTRARRWADPEHGASGGTVRTAPPGKRCRIPSRENGGADTGGEVGGGELSGGTRSPELLNFRAIRVGRFLCPVIANLQGLIRIERASARAVERLGNRGDSVACGRVLHRKDVAAVLAVRENLRAQIGRRGPGRATGRTAQLGQ